MNFLLVKELSTHSNYSITALTNYSMKIRITGGVKIYLDKVTLCWVVPAIRLTTRNRIQNDRTAPIAY